MTIIEFSKLVREALEAGVDAHTLAKELGCTRTIVRVWAEGRVGPSPRVMEFAAKKIIALRDQARP